MAKASRDDAVEAGERLLREWGIGDTSTAAEMAAALGRESEADLAIAHRLGGRAEDESVLLLRRLERESADKRLRKEAKRALYRLQQRGMNVSETPVAEPTPILTASPEGYLSAVDGRGDQLVWLVRPRPVGVAQLFGVINDPQGLREIDLNLATRKALKEFRAELARKHDLRLVAADWHYCDFLVRRAFEWARSRGARISGDYPALRAQISREPAPVDRPPLILAHVDVEAVRADPALLTESEELLAEPEFGSWFFGRDELRPYLDRLSGIESSPLVLNRAQQDERFADVIEGAIADLFFGELRDSWPRRLYEMAYFLWSTARHRSARQAVAVALALSGSSRDGRGIPFCERLALASLAMHFEAAVEEKEEEAKSSLIVTPRHIRAQRDRR
jgi:hypothetical protein